MKKLLTTVSILTFTAGVAWAQDFGAVDADANSMVSMEEATAAGLPWTEDEFKMADANGDGSLDADEFKAAIMK